jgi:hypothetical protein
MLGVAAVVFLFMMGLEACWPFHYELDLGAPRPCEAGAP